VEIEGVIPPIPAYIIDNEYWNGWAMPYFTREQAEVYAAAQRAFSGETTPEGNPTVTYQEYNDQYVTMLEGEGIESWGNEDIVIDGETIHTYPIGAGCWIWEEAV
jgi:hypothetical protein